MKLSAISSTLALLSGIYASSLRAEIGENYLAGLYSPSAIEKMAQASEAWEIFPRSADRVFWTALPDNVSGFLVQKGADYLDYIPEHLYASSYKRVADTGDRNAYQVLQRNRRNAMIHMMIAECVENEGRFIPKISDLAWMICEESWWGSPAHLINRQNSALPDQNDLSADLFVGDTAKDLALVYYFLKEPLDGYAPVLRERIFQEIDSRFFSRLPDKLEEFERAVSEGERINNWAAWLGKNWVACSILLEMDSSSRANELSAAFRMLDLYLQGFPADGSVNEGAGYWAAGVGRVYTVLNWMEYLNPEVDPFESPDLTRIFEFIAKTYIGNGYFVSNSDTTARFNVNAFLLADMALKVQSPILAELSSEFAPLEDAPPESYLTSHASFDIFFRNRLYELFSKDRIKEAQKLFEQSPALFTTDSWLKNLELFVARDSSPASPFTLTAKAGHNAESHNHNDVGVFAVYLDRNPLIVDPGKRKYTLSSFGSKRYTDEHWNHLSAYHNLPTIGGVQQNAGRDYKAESVTAELGKDRSSFSAELKTAYPSGSGIRSYVRTVTLIRGVGIQLNDRIHLTQATPIEIGFMTPCDIDVKQEQGLIVFTQPSGKSATMTYQKDLFDLSVKPLTLTDKQMKASWGKLTMVLFKTRKPVEDAEFTFEFSSE